MITIFLVPQTHKFSNPIYFIVVGIVILFSNGCSPSKPFYHKSVSKWEKADVPRENQIQQSVYLIGDTGLPNLDGEDPVFNLLSNHLYYNSDTIVNTPSASNIPEGITFNRINEDSAVVLKSREKDAVIFLGDNLYENGLPDTTAGDRELMESRLTFQLDILKPFKGRVYYVPGNHDWNKSQAGGLEAVIRQGQFMANYMDREILFPKSGCPGPVEVTLGKDLTVIFVDSEWWLTHHERPEGPENNCYVDDEFDFLVQLEDAIERNKDRNILVAMHHPLFSNGNHGGHYSFADNLFPLRLINSNNRLYLPLPVIGSLYPLLRKLGVSRQDIPNSKYQELKDGILDILEERKNIVFASGHDHNLQLKSHKDNHFVVSGSGSKVNYVAKANKATYVHRAKGFAKLNYYENGEVWIEYWIVDEASSHGHLSFRKPLYANKPKKNVKMGGDLIDFRDSTRIVKAGAQYKAGWFKQLWLGQHYRKEWRAPVKVPYLDIKSEAGGLTPLKKGGGKQTVSLRLLGDDSVQYTLRSVNKNPGAVIPSPFKNTFAQDLVQDQISSSHPYGAFAIPKLANAVGIYHTDPKLFYVPFTPLLGSYIDDFGGMLALMEVRPDEDLSHLKRFGKSSNVVSTRTLYKHLLEDNDNEVDQKMFLRARLFDMLIGDWDRHQDQWRWAEFEKEDKGSEFKPVPRDRDQVFTKFDGIIPWLMSRKWAVRELSHFDYKFDDIIGLNMSAVHLDKRLLNDLEYRDWKTVAEDIRSKLTDQIIEESVRQMPAEIFAISGGEIIAKLKSRRDQLVEAANSYYKVLAEVVDVVGTRKHEYFQIQFQDNGLLNVKVYKIKKEGKVKHLLYNRDFSEVATKEVNIYTLSGQDSVLIVGRQKNGIKLRVIGGEDENVIVDKSNSNKIFVYDNVVADNLIEPGVNTKVITSKNSYINRYNPVGFQYNYFGPRLYFEYNIDDGFFVGGGFNVKRHGFRKEPYAAEHTVLANYAFGTGSYNASYTGNFHQLLGRRWDLEVNAGTFGPKFIFNYFGQGNGTERGTEGINFYRVRSSSIQIEPTINFRPGQSFKMGFGPFFNYFKIADKTDSFIDSERFEEREDVDVPTYFVGLKLFATLDRVNYSLYPTKGIRWKNEVKFFNEFSNGSDSFVGLNTDLSFYLTPNLPFYLTLAMRFGASTNIGDYKFYQSNFLGGNQNLRGYRNFRFAGESSAYQNTELRMGLSKFSNYLFTGAFGLFGFVDTGRVWGGSVENRSDKWHVSYGPGIWVNFYKIIVLSSGYGISDEKDLFYFRFGMFF